MTKIDANQIAAFAAVLVSCAALFVAWDQARIMRQQQKAAVMPVMRVQSYLDFEGANHSVILQVENVGVGPAFIRGERVVWEGKPLAQWSQFIKAVLPSGLPSGTSISGEMITGALISPGDRTTMIRLSWPSNEKADAETRDRLLTLFGFSGDSTALEITLCYCSVFNQCWITQEVKGSLPVETKNCSTSWTPVRLDFQGAESLKEK